MYTIFYYTIQITNIDIGRYYNRLTTTRIKLNFFQTNTAITKNTIYQVPTILTYKVKITNE